jgi:3-isopropylmalate/(R)-2-methylmalate dehydratase small subunit
VEKLAAECVPGAPAATVDLWRREVVSPQGRRIPFTLPEFRYRQLIEGLDEIDMTLQQRNAIADYQRRAAAVRPWLFTLPRSNA